MTYQLLKHAIKEKDMTKIKSIKFVDRPISNVGKIKYAEYHLVNGKAISREYYSKSRSSNGKFSAKKYDTNGHKNQTKKSDLEFINEWRPDFVYYVNNAVYNPRIRDSMKDKLTNRVRIVYVDYY